MNEWQSETQTITNPEDLWTQPPTETVEGVDIDNNVFDLALKDLLEDQYRTAATEGLNVADPDMLAWSSAAAVRNYKLDEIHGLRRVVPDSDNT